MRYNAEKHHESVTALLGAWSELLLHDMASTGNMRSYDCCEDNANHGECFGRLGNGECQEYMRSLPAVDVDDCKFSEYTTTVSHVLYHIEVLVMWYKLGVLDKKFAIERH